MSLASIGDCCSTIPDCVEKWNGLVGYLEKALLYHRRVAGIYSKLHFEGGSGSEKVGGV